VLERVLIATAVGHLWISTSCGIENGPPGGIRAGLTINDAVGRDRKESEPIEQDGGKKGARTSTERLF
jgi:hypothetical protein